MYKTYQEAKIANPECEVYVHIYKNGFIPESELISTVDHVKCNPSDYCMTLGELRYLHGGEVVGDLLLGYRTGKVRTVSKDEANNKEFDSGNFVLHAAALEKPKRTKVEYEKVEFEPNEIWKAFKEHQEVGYLYVNTSDGFECLFDGVFNLAMAISQGDQLYRRIETEIDERQEFIEECQRYGSWEEMYDSGKFKLVN